MAGEQQKAFGCPVLLSATLLVYVGGLFMKTQTKPLRQLFADVVPDKCWWRY